MRIRRTALVVVLLAALLAGVWPGQAAPAAQVLVETDPPAPAIVPDDTLVTTRLRVVDANGMPVRGARVALHLDTPPRPKVITTDFPHVEDTTLIDLETVLPDGELRFQAVYPIRGTYTFRARVTLPDGQIVEATPTLSIRENPAEVRNMLIMVGLLFAFGFVSGLIVGSGRKRAGVAALVLAAFWLTGSTALAHNPSGKEPSAQAGPVTVTAEADGLRATATISPGSGAVGRLNEIVVRLTTADGQPVAGQISLAAIHLEDNVPIYRFDDLPLDDDGTARVAVQFFDGTEHELRFTARATDGRAVAWQVPVEVVGFPPPLNVKVRMWLLLLAVVALGLFLGLLVSGRRVDRQLASSGGYQYSTAHRN